MFELRPGVQGSCTNLLRMGGACWNLPPRSAPARTAF